MLVKYWMKKQFHSVNANDLMIYAMRIMGESRPVLLPVMKGERLVGVVTDRDLKAASASNKIGIGSQDFVHKLSLIKIQDIMSAPPITVYPNDTLEEAAAVFTIAGISSAPVVGPDDRVVGILSGKDIFRAVMSLAGFGKKGLQWAIEIKDAVGSIKEITDVIRKNGGRIVSILTSTEGMAPTRRILYLRVWNIDRGGLERLESEITEKATLLYRVDHKNGERKEFVTREKDLDDNSGQERREGH